MRRTCWGSRVIPGPLSSCAVGLVALVAVQACSSERMTAANPRSEVTHLEWYVYTPEGDTTRHLLTIGDTGYALMTALTDFGCVGGTPPCYAEVPGGVEFRSSDSSKVQPATRNMGVSGGYVVFVGKAPGSVYISARVQGLEASTLIVVTAASLPIDSVRLRQGLLNPYDPRLAVTTDGAANLVSVTLPVRYVFNPRILVFRAGDSTVYLPVTLTSSDSTVVWPWVNCLGFLTFDWMPCSNGGGGMSFFSGVGPGTTTVTLRARHQEYALLVTVQ